ncbi:hypothetical protein H6A60_06790 [Sutterella massiliensis]|uniref:MotA/TolQ/ExbB proton channel domain-containing protein n=1 Tax=Sutterella massiliensis TaxID=1816689 RepID=A0ABS2DSE3_9BURK|nr:hypothetical protein [Sutterella massiliensis]MBM6704188.1 hypothetical protein [Sutterella massiliensis]
MKVALPFTVLCFLLSAASIVDFPPWITAFFRAFERLMVMDTTASVTSALIVLIGCSFWIRYSMRSNTVLNNINQAQSALASIPTKDHESLISGWDTFRSELEAIDSNYRRIFDRYDGVIEDVSDVVKAHHIGTGHRWVSVVEPGAFFNMESLYHSALNVPFYASLPGILTGLGLFFTFVGLACGITLAQGGLVSGADGVASASSLSSVSGLIDSVSSLLGGAGQAFYTSIAGLLMSIIVGGAIVYQEKKIAVAIDRFNNSLEDRIPVVTTESLQLQMLIKTSEQEKFMRELVPQIKADMESFREALIGALKDNSKAISGSLEDAIKDLKQVLNNMLDKQSDEVAASLEKVIKRMEENLTQVLNNMSDSFRDSAQAVKISVELLDEVVAKLKTEVESSGEAAKTQILKLAEEAETVNKNLLGTLTTAVGTLNQEVDATAKALSETVQAAGTAMSNTIEAAGKSAEENINNLKEPVNELHEELRASVETLQADFDAMEASAARTKAEFEAIASQMGTAMGSVGDAIGALKQEAEQFSTTVETLRALLEQAEETARKLVNGKNAADDTIKGTIKGVEEVMKAATDAVSRELMHLQSMLKEIGESQNNVLVHSKRVNEMMDTSVTKLAEALEAIHSSLARNLDSADQKLSSAVTHMSDGFQTWRDEQKDSYDELAKAVDSLSKTVKDWVKAEETRARTAKEAAAAQQRLSSTSLPGGKA